MSSRRISSCSFDVEKKKSCTVPWLLQISQIIFPVDINKNTHFLSVTLRGYLSTPLRHDELVTVLNPCGHLERRVQVVNGTLYLEPITSHVSPHWDDRTHWVCTFIFVVIATAFKLRCLKQKSSLPLHRHNNTAQEVAGSIPWRRLEVKTWVSIATLWLTGELQVEGQNNIATFEPTFSSWRE